MSPSKLTDTQLVLLSAASQREDGALDIAENPKRGSVKKAISKLLTDGLVEEVPAGGLLPAWRRDDDQGPRPLRTTARGLAAIGIDKAGALPQAPLISGRTTAEEVDPTPDAPSQTTTALHRTAASRRAAAVEHTVGRLMARHATRPRSARASAKWALSSHLPVTRQRNLSFCSALLPRSTLPRPTANGRGFSLRAVLSVNQ
jgi:hypothetical protein